jgi:hypothetical protein
MLIVKTTKQIFLKEDYDKKFGMPLNDSGDICLCCMGYPEFETVSYYGIQEALNCTVMDFLDGNINGFETFDELVEYMCHNYI